MPHGSKPGAEYQPPVILRAGLHYGPPLFGYSLAFILIAVTAALRLALIQEEPSASFLFFYPAIAAAAFLAGAGPGLTAILLAALFNILLFPGPPDVASWIPLAVLGPLFVTGFAHLRLLRDQNRAISRELASFKFIGDHATDWILLLDEAGCIRYANQRACADLGFAAAELTGRTIESLASESQRPALRAHLKAVKSVERKPIEVTFERREKSPVLIELSCTGVRIRGDYVVYATARDVGERKRMELERRRNEQNLQEVRRWESLGVLAGGLAHDFNNLLTTILGYSSLAKDSLPEGHEAMAMLDSIVSAAERSADLVRMMLATSGYRPRYNERLQLDRLLDWMLANRPLPPGIQIRREVESALFSGDRRSFDTMLWSLILNAAEAYGDDEGLVEITIRYGAAPRETNATFEEGDAGDGECLGIAVEDRGCGMTPDVLARAFDPFFSTKFPGRGLGLPAVRGIVRAYSGKLLLETAPGHGTRVEVWLPAQDTG